MNLLFARYEWHPLNKGPFVHSFSRSGSICMASKAKLLVLPSRSSASWPYEHHSWGYPMPKNFFSTTKKTLELKRQFVIVESLGLLLFQCSEWSYLGEKILLSYGIESFLHFSPLVFSHFAKFLTNVCKRGRIVVADHMDNSSTDVVRRLTKVILPAQVMKPKWWLKF